MMNHGILIDSTSLSERGVQAKLGIVCVASCFIPLQEFKT